jgi:hypothetical protein
LDVVEAVLVGAKDAGQVAGLMAAFDHRVDCRPVGDSLLFGPGDDLSEGFLAPLNVGVQAGGFGRHIHLAPVEGVRVKFGPGGGLFGGGPAFPPPGRVFGLPASPLGAGLGDVEVPYGSAGICLVIDAVAGVEIGSGLSGPLQLHAGFLDGLFEPGSADLLERSHRNLGLSPGHGDLADLVLDR